MSGKTPDVPALHRSCVESLKRYISEANKTCSMLNDIRSFPISLQQKLAIIEQRARENQAQSNYQLARSDLFEAARWGD